jgi:hypothetical protein
MKLDQSWNINVKESGEWLESSESNLDSVQERRATSTSNGGNGVDY